MVKAEIASSADVDPKESDTTVGFKGGTPVQRMPKIVIDPGSTVFTGAPTPRMIIDQSEGNEKENPSGK